MAKFKSTLYLLLAVAMLGTSSMMIGCSSSVDEEQMQLLNDLKAEVQALQDQVRAKEDEKASLQKQISDKDAKIKKCNDDMAKTKSCLDKWGKEGK